MNLVNRHKVQINLYIYSKSSFVWRHFESYKGIWLPRFMLERFTWKCSCSLLKEQSGEELRGILYVPDFFAINQIPIYRFWRISIISDYSNFWFYIDQIKFIRKEAIVRISHFLPFYNRKFEYSRIVNGFLISNYSKLIEDFFSNSNSVSYKKFASLSDE